MKDRIEKIMEKEQLSASKFADAIGVQRSSISHILSGRNKPSLELVNKILDRFDNINADWLLLGKGDMAEENQSHSKPGSNGYTFQSQPQNDQSPTDEINNAPVPVRVVIFYSDNTFEEFRSR